MAYRPPILDAFNAPLTIIIIIILCIIYYYLNSRNVPIENVASNSQLILDRKQYWRTVTASFSHYSFLHLVMNIGSFYTIGGIEKYLKISQYFKYIVILTILPPIIDSLIRKHFDINPEINGVGFSCVLFGFETIIASYSSQINVFGYQIPISFMPIFSCIVISILVPNASFIGHISGIIIGYLITWHVFDWITTQFFWNILPWIVILMLLNYKRSFPDRFKFFSMSKTPPTTTQNGNLVQTP